MAGAALDHLVIAAQTLGEGVTWCQRVFGMTPAEGGRHALFGTHNRLLRLHGANFPDAYLEIIAIEPNVRPTRQAPLARWFDLDDPGLRRRLQFQGPQIIHWVARVPDLAQACQAWSVLGIDRGSIIDASRQTPEGLLRWKISIRDDGQRLFGGALPTLIEWQGEHPCKKLPARGPQLNRLELSHPDRKALTAALAAVGLDSAVGVSVNDDPAGLHAQLSTVARNDIHLWHPKS
ncbi:VOC family protein [Hydrogenophaga sp. 5NK40-0174]|uniref:VOC family protein n=1 Tax=Hydrogenophaga sp. 5NK40-0174 TaxID=3127649 RepID=UPI00333FB6CF